MRRMMRLTLGRRLPSFKKVTEKVIYYLTLVTDSVIIALLNKSTQRKIMTNQQLNKILNAIASEELDIETLETQNRDDADFHEVAVWAVKDALKAAFEAGQKSVK